MELKIFSEQTMELRMQWDAMIPMECDRCLDEIEVPLKGFNVLRIQRASSAPVEDGEDHLSIGYQEHFVDLSQWVYESVAVMIPYRKIPCELLGDTSVCNTEMLTRLKNISTDDTGSGTGAGIWEGLQGFSPEN